MTPATWAWPKFCSFCFAFLGQFMGRKRQQSLALAKLRRKVEVQLDEILGFAVLNTI